MCGIAGYYIKDPSVVRSHEAMERFTDLLYTGIEHRGKQATGFVSVCADGKGAVFHKDAKTASDFIKVRKRIPVGSRIVLLHTRFKTKGDLNKNENNHPVLYNGVFTTHNGSIDNDDALFKSEELERKAEVDTEIISAMLSKHGLTKFADFADQLDGKFAIAAIDPDNHPDTLVLAKGDYSPLIVHESDKFIVWASEQKAIREAWKVILGTPPADRTFQRLSAGDVWIVTPEGVVKNKFTPFVRPVSQPSSTGSYKPRCAVTGGRTSQETGQLDADMIEKVGVLRDAGRGKARLFKLREKYTEDDMKGVTGLVWPFCLSCKTAVLQDDHTDTLAWGRMCIDCYAIKTQPWEGSATSDSDDEELTPDEQTTLDNWASMEAEVHRLTLKAVAGYTGHDADTVDFLIFRVPKTYLDRQPRVEKLATDLDELYQLYLDETWESFGVKDPDNLRHAAERRAIALPPATATNNSTTQGFCGQHNRHFYGSDKCSVCTHIARSENVGPPNLQITSCTICKHAPRYYGAKFAWCRKHFNECSSCGANTKHIKANATTASGRRICHYCCRGKKGVVQDGAVQIAERITA